MGQEQSPKESNSLALTLVNLTPLMQRTIGKPDIVIGLIDGPVALGDPDLAGINIGPVSDAIPAGYADLSSMACVHGTFVAGILAARRGADAPAICPGCTLLVRPIFPEGSGPNDPLPTASPVDLARAIVQVVEAGARIVNLSVAIQATDLREQRMVTEALNYAARAGAIIVAASGNEGAFASSAITRHDGVIPVAACDLDGTPLSRSNLGRIVGTRGLMAPGAGVESLGPLSDAPSLTGTSVAAPFVTGAIALLWSEFPSATAEQIRFGLRQAHGGHRPRVVPPLLDAVKAYWSIADILR